MTPLTISRSSTELPILRTVRVRVPIVLQKILIGEEALLLTHVKQKGNRVVNTMANTGIESKFSFHA